MARLMPGRSMCRLFSRGKNRDTPQNAEIERCDKTLPLTVVTMTPVISCHFVVQAVGPLDDTALVISRESLPGRSPTPKGDIRLSL
jgi:hypothetical protein